MTSHAGSRKRMRMMGGASSIPTNPGSTSAGSSSRSKEMASTGAASCQGGPCSHEQLLRTLNTDIEAMRQLVTCKVCDRLLYEPYALACGHTYCYQCLRQWFDNNPQKKTCPDCRVIVRLEPTPSYLLRELVLIFVSRNELLPDGETADEHHKWSKEESELVAKDKANTHPRRGGLFQGIFKSRNGVPRGFGALHDPGDNVSRCPACHWELEGGFCNHCGETVTNDSDIDSASDLSDEDLDHELDAEDVAAIWGVDGEDNFLGLPPGLEGQYYSSDEEDDEGETMEGSEEEDHHDRHLLRPLDDERVNTDEEADLMGFVVGDDEVAYASDDGGDSEATDVPRRRRLFRRMSPVVISDDEGDTAASAGAPVTEEEGEDSEDEPPIIRAGQRSKHRRGPGSAPIVARRLVIDSDESSSEHSHSDDETNNGHGGDDMSNVGGFSPLEEESHAGPSDYTDLDEFGYTEDNYGSHDDDDDDDDDDGWGTETQTPRREGRAVPAAASHRLTTLDRHSSRHTTTLGSHRLDFRGSPSNFASASRTRATSGQRTNLPIQRRANDQVADGLSNRAGGGGPITGRSRIERASNVAPRHPFQLDNTLAAINENHDRRAPRPMLQRYLAPSLTSASSESGSNSTVRDDRRRKRAISLSSDDTRAAIVGSEVW